MLVSICSRVAPSRVVGICVGSELGWPLLMVTTPSDLLGALLVSSACAKGSRDRASTPVRTRPTTDEDDETWGKATARADAMRLLRMGTPDMNGSARTGGSTQASAGRGREIQFR